MDVSRSPSAPPLALVDPEGRIVRSTAAFALVHSGGRSLDERPRELDAVLAGHVDSATCAMGKFALSVRAVTDAAGARAALLAAAVDVDDAGVGHDPVALMRDLLEETQVISWIKDLDGRYLYVNPQYTAAVQTPADELLGHRDDELAPSATVDGPRIALGEEISPEPRQLEYTVPAFEGRLPLTVWRLVLREDDDRPVAICGVAAPTEAAQQARAEIERLVALERWRRMDPEELTAEVLREWDVAQTHDRVTGTPASGDGESSADWELDLEQLEALPADGEAPVPAGSGQDLERRWNECVARLQAEAQRWREEIGQARAAQEELARTRRECEELRSALAREHERLEELMQTLGQVHARIADLDSAMDQALGVETR